MRNIQEKQLSSCGWHHSLGQEPGLHKEKRRNNPFSSLSKRAQFVTVGDGVRWGRRYEEAERFSSGHSGSRE